MWQSYTVCNLSLTESRPAVEQREWLYYKLDKFSHHDDYDDESFDSEFHNDNRRDLLRWRSLMASSHNESDGDAEHFGGYHISASFFSDSPASSRVHKPDRNSRDTYTHLHLKVHMSTLDH